MFPSADVFQMLSIQEEESKAQKDKEEEAATLEFEIWKGEFSVDEEGTTGNEAEDGNQDLLSGFVDYINWARIFG